MPIFSLLKGSFIIHKACYATETFMTIIYTCCQLLTYYQRLRLHGHCELINCLTANLLNVTIIKFHLTLQGRVGEAGFQVSNLKLLPICFFNG